MERLRFAAAVIFLASMCLPLSECRYHVDSSGNRVSEEAAQANPGAMREVHSTHTPLEESTGDRWIYWSGFIAPFVLAAALGIARRRWLLITLRCLEPAAIAWAGFCFAMFMLFYEPTGYGYAAAVVLGLYAVAALVIDVLVVRNWWRDRRRRRSQSAGAGLGHA